MSLFNKINGSIYPKPFKDTCIKVIYELHLAGQYFQNALSTAFKQQQQQHTRANISAMPTA